MNASKLKEYIIENDLTIKILESIGCHSIHCSEKEIRCALPNKTNDTALSIKSNLYVRSYSADNEFQGDIITLVMEICKISFVGSIKYIHKILDIPYKYEIKKEEKNNNPLDIFLKASSHNSNEVDIDLINKSCLSEYIHHPHINFVREGILASTHKEFAIAYDPETHRIVIPHRYWSGDRDEFIGIIGRTVIDNWKELGVHKYFPLKKHPKSINIYGLNENYKTIQDKGHVVVFEAEKSVLKRHSRFDGTGVALCGHSISKEQVKILSSLNVEIVIALDKDIDEYRTYEICENFYKTRKVSFILDRNNILGQKDSPADAHNDLYVELFNNRETYDIQRHKEYLKMKEDRYGKK